jgi:hypothetical protein
VRCAKGCRRRSGEVILQRADTALRFSLRGRGPAAAWSAAAATTIPDVGANINAGTLPDGRVCLTMRIPARPQRVVYFGIQKFHCGIR